MYYKIFLGFVDVKIDIHSIAYFWAKKRLNQEQYKWKKSRNQPSI